MVTFIDEWRRKFPSCMVVKRLNSRNFRARIQSVFTSSLFCLWSVGMVSDGSVPPCWPPAWTITVVPCCTLADHRLTTLQWLRYANFVHAVPAWSLIDCPFALWNATHSRWWARDNVALTLDQFCRRWTNFKTTLVQRLDGPASLFFLVKGFFYSIGKQRVLIKLQEEIILLPLR